MIAYVFWHTPLTTDREAYEANLISFHRALKSAPPPGFLGSTTAAVRQAPWIDGGDGYEDWYLVDGMPALEALNDGAISGSRVEAHSQVSKLTSWGTAGIYKPVGPTPESIAGKTAVWFAKPVGLSYPSMFSHMEASEAGVTNFLWQRMMTLGPTPEFCLMNSGPDLLPFGWSSEMVVRKQIVIPG